MQRRFILIFGLCGLLLTGCADASSQVSEAETNPAAEQTTAAVPESDTEPPAPAETTQISPALADFGDTADPEETAPVLTAAPPLRGAEPYYVLRGTVNTKSDKLLLRRNASTAADADGRTNVITSMQKGEQVTVLAQTYNPFDRKCGSWYLVDYDGAIGYTAAEYILPGTAQYAVTDRELLAVAQCLYLHAMTAEAWEYSNCFLYDANGQRLTDPYQNHAGDVQYLPLSNDTGAVTGKDGFLSQIHSFFAPKYDSMRYRGNFSTLTDASDGCYIFYHDCWYLNDVIFNKGALIQGVVSEAPHQIIRLKQTNSGSAELHFSGYLDFSQTEMAQEGWTDISIDDFSICFEGGRFKVGYYHDPAM